MNTSPLDTLLPRLKNVKKAGSSKWSARCPAHEDKGPSLAIRQCDDGRLLIHCFAGCQTTSILDAIGLELSDLFLRTDDPDSPHKPLHKPYYPTSAHLKSLYNSLVVISISAAQLYDNYEFSDADLLALRDAALTLANTVIEIERLP
jgi:hypothetical protein